jgi:hypothetical protein
MLLIIARAITSAVSCWLLIAEGRFFPATAVLMRLVMDEVELERDFLCAMKPGRKYQGFGGPDVSAY